MIVGEPLKSLALLSVSVQPPLSRTTLDVLLGAAVGPVPSKQFAVPPKPTKSTTVAPPFGHVPVRAVGALTRATLPAVPDMFIAPMASAVGRTDPQGRPAQPVPAASCTRKYLPDWIVPVIVVTCQLEPVADAYCTDHPATLMGPAVGLKTSMKSFCHGALALPPPPYTWLITRLVPPGLAGLTALETP
jgi:hypothetical protein